MDAQNICKGGGEYEGTIQMRKETSYLSNTEPVRFNSLTIYQLDTTNDPWNPYYGMLNLYYGNAFGDVTLKSDGVAEATTFNGQKAFKTVYELDGEYTYFALKNDDMENARAAYCFQIVFETI